MQLLNRRREDIIALALAIAHSVGGARDALTLFVAQGKQRLLCVVQRSDRLADGVGSLLEGNCFRAEAALQRGAIAQLAVVFLRAFLQYVASCAVQSSPFFAFRQERCKAGFLAAPDGQTELKDRAFIARRIRECEAAIRKLQRNVESYEASKAKLEAGTPLKRLNGEALTLDTVNAWIDETLDQMEAQLDKLGYYQEMLLHASQS